MIRLIVCYFNIKLPLAIRGSPAPKKARETPERPHLLKGHAPSNRPPPGTAQVLLLSSVPFPGCRHQRHQFAVVALDVSFLVLVGWFFSPNTIYIYIYLSFFDSTKKENMISCEFVLGPCFVLFYLTGGNL